MVEAVAPIPDKVLPQLTKSGKYARVEDARQAAMSLGILTMAQYRREYTRDSALPSSPHTFYGYFDADGRRLPFLESKIYPTLDQAKEATARLGIISTAMYQERRHEDPGLPSNPSKQYPDYKSAGGAKTFFCSRYYETVAEWINAVNVLGIVTLADYDTMRHKDNRLPRSPFQVYPELIKWRNVRKLLGNDIYPTYEEARLSVQNLGITSMPEYESRYKEDPMLPSELFNRFSAVWSEKGGADAFFGVFHSRLSLAREAVEILGISSRDEYNERYHEDPLLPPRPQLHYLSYHSAGGDQNFFTPKFYKTLPEWAAAAKALGITSGKQYINLRKKNPLLAPKPFKFYPEIKALGGIARVSKLDLKLL